MRQTPMVCVVKDTRSAGPPVRGKNREIQLLILKYRVCIGPNPGDVRITTISLLQVDIAQAHKAEISSQQATQRGFFQVNPHWHSD